MEAMRRYEVAAVRRRAVGHALPRAYLQADLDLVAPPAASLTEAALAEAEVIKVRSEGFRGSGFRVYKQTNPKQTLNPMIPAGLTGNPSSSKFVNIRSALHPKASLGVELASFRF